MHPLVDIAARDGSRNRTSEIENCTSDFGNKWIDAVRTELQNERARAVCYVVLRTRERVLTRAAITEHMDATWRNRGSIDGC